MTEPLPQDPRRAPRTARHVPRRGAVRVASLLVALAATGACSTGGDPGAADDASPSASPAAALETITAAGVAAVVHDHLGDRVRRLGTYGEDGGDEGVGLMVQLRGGDRRDAFAVTVAGPDGAEELGGGPGGGCDELDGVMEVCRELPGGGLVSAGTTPYGFSDDNVRGSTLMGSAYRPEVGVAYAMYETYGDRLLVDPEELADLLADPRLTWQTDPAVNAEGERLEVRRLEG